MVESHLHEYTLLNATQNLYFDDAQNVSKFSVKNGKGKTRIIVYVYEADVCHTTTHAVACPTDDQFSHRSGIAGTRCSNLDI